MHETNTFSNLPTNLDSYRARSLYLGDVVKKKSAGTKTEIAAFLDFCEDNNWEAICPIYADATPGGKVTEEAFNFVSSEILNSLNQFGPFDGVMLALHGAMVCEHIDDGEGELLKKIREQIGTEVPIQSLLTFTQILQTKWQKCPTSSLRIALILILISMKLLLKRLTYLNAL